MIGVHASRSRLPVGTAQTADLQRACSCGQDEDFEDVQTKPSVNRPGDRYEREADRVADAVVSDSRTASALGPITPLVQRAPGGDVEDEEEVQTKRAGGTPGADAAARAATIASSGGTPLSASERCYFEPRFGRDLSDVRLHTDAAAQSAASGISARAYTHRNHIAFAAGEYAPDSPEGRRLMAHEITHTMQQSGSAGQPVHRAPEDVIQRAFEDVVTGQRREAFTDRPGAETRMRQLREQHPDRTYRVHPSGSVFVVQVWVGENAPSEEAPEERQPAAQVCGRDDTTVAGSRISRIEVDMNDMGAGLSITWETSNAETRALPSTFPISPGAGRCNRCCNEREDSRAGGSLCTPIGAGWTIDRKSTRNPRCQLGNTSWAHNASYFADSLGRGIAIHTGPRPGFPASHGCVRTSETGSEIIYDNAPIGTPVQVNDEWNGRQCYPSASGARRNRRTSERCDSSASAVGPQHSDSALAFFEPSEDIPENGAGPLA